MNFGNLPRRLYIPAPDDRDSINKLDYSVLAGVSDSGQSACFCTLGTVYKKRLKRFTRKL